MIGTIRIELRKGVSAKNGMLPLSLIYSLAGIRKRYSLNQVIFSEYWDVKGQRAFYIQQREAKKILAQLPAKCLLTEKEINDINKDIDKAILKIEGIEDKFKANNVPFSSEMVVNELKAIKDAKPITKKEETTGLVFDFMDQYIRDHQATREKRKPNSL